MKNGVKHLVVVAAALGTVLAMPARAVEVKAGSWDLSFNGNVNAFATYQSCGVNPSIDGLPLACSKTSKDQTGQFSIESGLLPSALVLGAKTRTADMDTSATLGFYPGLHVSDTRTGAGSNGNFSIDVRQLFITFGDKSWGTVKLGKDIGLFGSDAILSDMLLLGVGAGSHGELNHNVTVGHIGTGYLYADWIPQLAYTTPSFGGLAVTVAVVEPFSANTVDKNGNPANGISGFIGNKDLRNDTPGIQARVAYDFAGPVAGRAWVGGMYQNTKQDAPPANPSLSTIAGEAGIRVNASGLGALAYGYVGDGVGTTLIGLDALASVGGALLTRTTYGFFGQVTYAIPNTKLRPGLSYGQSFVDLARGEAGPSFLRSNAMATAALFYSVTESLTLTAEFDHVRAKSQADALAKSNQFAFGGIFFF